LVKSNMRAMNYVSVTLLGPFIYPVHSERHAPPNTSELATPRSISCGTSVRTLVRLYTPSLIPYSVRGISILSSLSLTTSASTFIPGYSPNRHKHK